MQVMRKREKMLWAAGLILLIILFVTNLTAKASPHFHVSEFGSMRDAQGAVGRRNETDTWKINKNATEVHSL